MNSKFFLKHGYQKITLDELYVKKLKYLLIKKIKKKIKTKSVDLDYFHNYYQQSKINNLRIHLYKEINNDKNFQDLIYKSAKYYIDEMVGSEIAKSKSNLSIQFPHDDKSLLSMHSDFFSGESIFQINLWIPFVDVKKTKSMFIINPIKSIEILKKIKRSKQLTFSQIHKNYQKYMRWINLKFGEAIIFSPNCLHGNVTNLEKTSRWSINIRYKNLYSPYNSIFGNEKKIGTFYKMFEPKLITKFNLIHNFNEFQK